MNDRAVVAAACIAAAAALVAPPVPLGVAVAAATALVGVAILLRHPLVVIVAVALLVGARAHDQLAALAAPIPTRVEGVAELADDPRPAPFGTDVVLRIDGRRYVAQVPFELSAPLHLAGTGDHVRVAGRTAPLRGAPEGWVRSRHLAGRLQVTRLDRGPPAAPWFAAANAVRGILRAGASTYGDEHSPLYLGMVIGDDRALSELRQFRFGAAGLTHLTAVSGQNVAFVIAVASPLLDRLGRRGRAAAIGLLLVAFGLVTRADPSVLRAATMSAVAVLAVTTGRLAPAVRVLALTVMLLSLVDPLLVHALGFQLSVAATAGLVTLAGPIDARLPGPPWLRLPLAVTLAAQLATAPLLLGLNGGIPVAAVPANLLAVPAAGLVMMLGITVGLVAGLVVEPVAAVLQLPGRVLVGWIDTVARLASQAPTTPLGPGRFVAAVGGLAAMVVAVSARTVPPGQGSGSAGARRARRTARRPASRRLVVVAAAAVVVWVCWPARPTVGRSELTGGVTLVRGACGGTAVQLGTEADTEDALVSLQRSGVRRVDVLVVDPSRNAGRTASAVQQQWPVRRRLDLPVADPLRLGVGGVEVSAGGDRAAIELSAAACRLTR